MLSFLRTHIIYSYNDMSHFLVQGLGQYRNDPYLWGYTNNLGQPVAVIDHLLYQTVIELHKYIHPILLNNILILIFFVLAIIAGYSLFRLLDNSRHKGYAMVFALLYATSTYFIFRIISYTFSMYTIFVFPLLLYLLKKESKSYAVGLFVFVVLMLSNYYGFFSLVVAFSWYFSALLFNERNKQALLDFVKNVGFLLISVLVPVVIFFSSQLTNNLPALGVYENKPKAERPQNMIYRPIEDFYNFSFRPWYFVVPPKSSVFFGSFSKDFYTRLEATGNYLLDDYTEDEAAGSFMGWHFVLGMFFVFFLLIRFKLKENSGSIFTHIKREQITIKRLFFVAIVIIAISLPPSVAIKGIELYTPSYLLYHVVPVFRTMVRWASVLYLLVLCINYFLFVDLLTLLKRKPHRAIVLALFLLINFVSFAIYVPVKNISTPPTEIAYMAGLGDKPVTFAVYPKGDYYSVFWVVSHENYIVNPVGLVNTETNFNALEFSQNLITNKGLEEAQKLGVTYLLYYPEEVSAADDINSESAQSFFTENLGNPIFSSPSVYVFELNHGE